MNLLHIKYAVEVAETGSINKAAERLLIGQPNLSRAVKELECSLGIKIFDRSAKGMTLTPEGETFMSYAKSILGQVDALEATFTKGLYVKQRFSAAAHPSGYISEAFASFSMSLSDKPDAELIYKETSSSHVISCVLQDECRLGIIRYAEDHDNYYKSTLEEKGLNYEMIAEFTPVLITGKDCPALCESITDSALAGCTELVLADPNAPTAPISELKKSDTAVQAQKIFVFERQSLLEVLSANKNAYMWSVPMSNQMLERYGLMQRTCSLNKSVYKDVLIYKKDLSLTKLDNMFIEALIRAKRNIFK